jgi:hypothetical protein
MVDPGAEKWIPRLLGNAGSGFLLGQGISLGTSCYHAAVHAPSGNQIRDLLTTFSLASYQNGPQTVAWSIVNTGVESITDPLIRPGWARSAFNGALTGGILQVRYGTAGVISGAFGGAVQSIGFTLLQRALVEVIVPIQRYRLKQAKERFAKERAQEMFANPLSVLASAFWPKT